MARTVTRAQLRNRARQLANMESATNLWPDADLNTLIDTKITEVYDLLRAAAPPDYYSTSEAIAVVNGTTSYALPSTFLDAQSVYVGTTPSDTNAAKVEYMLRPVRTDDRPYLQPPSTSYPVVLEYTPSFTTLSNDASTFDGINGYEELVVNMVARDMLTKARESTDQVDPMIGALKNRITSMANRDRGAPQYIRDVYQDDFHTTHPATPSLYAYRIRGANIEFFEYQTRWP